MSSRFGSNLSHRDAKGSLFSSFDSRASSQSPARPASSRSSVHRYDSPYGASASPALGHNDSSGQNGPSFGAYPAGGGAGGFRAATPNQKGQYSDAVLNELESQNDEQVGMMTEKVRMLKNITMAIGDEIKDSTALAEKMNDTFDSTSQRLKGTWNRMLRMASRSGVGWRAWVAFFIAVIILFWYVWLS